MHGGLSWARLTASPVAQGQLWNLAGYITCASWLLITLHINIIFHIPLKDDILVRTEDGPGSPQSYKSTPLESKRCELGAIAVDNTHMSSCVFSTSLLFISVIKINVRKMKNKCIILVFRLVTWCVYLNTWNAELDTGNSRYTRLW